MKLEGMYRSIRDIGRFLQRKKGEKRVNPAGMEKRGKRRSAGFTVYGRKNEATDKIYRRNPVTGHGKSGKIYAK